MLVAVASVALGSLGALRAAGDASSAAVPPPRVTAAAAPPLVGAIRWDAYFATPGTAEFEDKNFGVVSRATTGDMSAKKWHCAQPLALSASAPSARAPVSSLTLTTDDPSAAVCADRLPFFGKEINDTAVVVNGNSADVMGQELEYAAQHGINFWPFCNYPIGCKDYHPPDADCAGIQCCADNVGLSYAWNQYLAHPDNHKVNFTLLLQPGYWFHGQESGSNETWPEELARYMTYFKMPNYQKVDIGEPGRPLVFSFGRDVNQSHLQDFRAATKKAVGVEPYFVSMNGQKLPEIDALSAYVRAVQCIPNHNMHASAYLPACLPALWPALNAKHPAARRVSQRCVANRIVPACTLIQRL
jgi:hypothetical protein